MWDLREEVVEAKKPSSAPSIIRWLQPQDLVRTSVEVRCSLWLILVASQPMGSQESMYLIRLGSAHFDPLCTPPPLSTGKERSAEFDNHSVI